MEHQNAVPLTEGQLTNAIFEMEKLVDRLDPDGTASVPRHPVLGDGISDRIIDSFSDNDSNWNARVTPLSSASRRTAQSHSEWDLLYRVSTLGAHLNVSKEEMKALLRANTALRDKNIILTKKAKESEEKYGTLKERLHVLRKQIQRTRKVSDDFNKEHKNDCLPVRVEQTREKDCAIRALRQQIDKLTSNLGRSESAQQKQSRELHVARETIEELEEKLKLIGDENINLRDSVEYLNSEIQYLQQEKEDNLSKRNKTLNIHNEHNKTLSDKLEQISKQLVTSERDLEIQINENKMLTTKLRESQRDLYQSRKETSKQKHELKELLHERQVARMTLSSEEEELNGLRNSVKVYIGRIRKQADKIRDLEDRLFEYEKRELVKAPVKVSPRRNDRVESVRTESPVETPSSPVHDHI